MIEGFRLLLCKKLFCHEEKLSVSKTHKRNVKHEKLSIVHKGRVCPVSLVLLSQRWTLGSVHPSENEKGKTKTLKPCIEELQRFAVKSILVKAELRQVMPCDWIGMVYLNFFQLLSLFCLVQCFHVYVINRPFIFCFKRRSAETCFSWSCFTSKPKTFDPGWAHCWSGPRSSCQVCISSLHL